jgi:hypothetical protein
MTRQWRSSTLGEVQVVAGATLTVRTWRRGALM